MNIKYIEKCRGCHAEESFLKPVLAMDPMPLAGMFCESRQSALDAPVFPLTWMHCFHCGLVQVREDIDDQFLFVKYNYASSGISGLVRHFEMYAEFLRNRFGSATALRFLEIGCNDGVLLNRLPRDWKLKGFDPSDVAGRAVKSNTGYELFPAPFNPETAKGNVPENSIDVISASNCLAHISDLKAVFHAARHALKPGGEFWIEVHDLDALLKGAQWDTIYHEHKVEWSEGSLIRCVTPVGFEHLKTFRTPMHGGALRIGFAKSTQVARENLKQITIDPRLELLRESYERRYESPAARRLAEMQDRGKPFAAYGASGRANVYLNQISKLAFAYIVDEAPLRKNKFLPRIATPISGPDMLTRNPVEACLITAWNYRDDIIKKNPLFKGNWLTAFDAG
jgi:SAM-dependent methyltransferase